VGQDQSRGFNEGYAMKQNVRDQLEMRLRRAAVASFAIGALAAGTVHASPPSPVVVPPTDLPALADALTVTHPTTDAAPALNFGAIDTVLSYELNRMFDVKQVSAQMTLE
jgi:hypothetical protein